jgi:hypothetical protein
MKHAMAENENELEQQPGNRGDEPIAGLDDLLYSLAGTLRTKRSKEAVAGVIEEYTKMMPVVAEKRHRAILWSYGFTLTIFAAVGFLGYLKVISGEITATLLGAIIGSLFYPRK